MHLDFWITRIEKSKNEGEKHEKKKTRGEPARHLVYIVDACICSLINSIKNRALDFFDRKTKGERRKRYNMKEAI